MRGRRRVPDEVQLLKGNPRKRRLPARKIAAVPWAERAPKAPPFEFPEFLTHEREREIYRRVVEDYLRRRVAQKPDLIAYGRWAHYVHRWWRCREKLAEGDTHYQVTSKHGSYFRPLPAVKEQFDLERILQALEDRLGLNPVARQNITRGLASMPAALGGLFDAGEPAPAEPQPETPAPDESPLGFLNRSAAAAPAAKPN